MKNYLLLLLTFTMVALVMSSCKKDDETSDTDIVGLWKAVSGSATNCDDPADNVENADFSLLACNETTMATGCSEISYDFKSDGTFVNEIKLFFYGSDLGEEISGTYTVTGNEIEVCADGNCGTIMIEGGQITLDNGKDPDTGCESTLILEKE